MTKEEAIKWVDDRMCWGRGAFTENHPPNIDECWEAGRMAIEALQERPNGEWVVKEHCSNENGFRKWIEIECPFCGEKPTYENLDNMNFCPKCGKDLRGGKG